MSADDEEQLPADTPTIDTGNRSDTNGASSSEDTPTIASSESNAKGDESIVPRVGRAGQFFGDYELLEEIARGGMGVVFKARQKNLNRVVALKMILAGQFAGQKDVQRFQTEAESAAQLDHPGIVPIFDIGEHDGQNYFSMGYVDGQSLADRVADGPLAPEAAASLVKKISESMAYAHQCGVIHRDLKPANVLLDKSGQPKITDFGLAKKTEADSDLTGTGQVLGTPAYMPPEQASGNVTEIGPLADVYALGAILYCLMTGRPPFQAASTLEVLRQVLDEEPVPARQLVPTIPRDLATICGKCLSKDPAKRYASASDLADDLGRHLSDQPIQARPAGRIERASKWASKQPTIAAILLTMPAWLFGEPKIGVGLLALIAGFHLPFRFRYIRIGFVFVMTAIIALFVSGMNAIFVTFEGEPPEATARTAAIYLVCMVAPVAAAISLFLFDCVSELPNPNRRRGRWLMLVSCALSIVCVGGFFFYLRDHGAQVSAIVDQLSDEIISLTASTQPDVEEAKTSDGMVQLFRSRTVLWIPVYVAIIGLYLVLGIVTARFIRRFVFVTDKTTRRTRWSQLVKTVDGDVSRWLAITAAVAVAILPYVVGSLIGVYDVRLMQAFELGGPLNSIIWVFAASWLAAFAVISRRRFWIASVIASSMGLFLAYGTNSAIQYNLQLLPAESVAGLPKVDPDPSLWFTLDGHTGPVKCIDVNSSGDRAASVSGWPDGDGSLRIWNLESNKLYWVRHMGPAKQMAVTFTADGKRVLAAGDDGWITVWETETARELDRIQAAQNIQGIHMLDGGQHFIVAGTRVQRWDLTTGELVREYDGPDERQLDVSVSADSKRVATCGMDNAVHVWDIESGDQVAKLEFSSQAESVALNSDGTRALIALDTDQENSDPNLIIVSVEDPSDKQVLVGHDSTVNWIRYSNDRKWLISASRDRSIRVWDAETLKETKVILGHQDWVWSAVFTPDGNRIISGGGGVDWDNSGSDFSLRIWHATEESQQDADDETN